MITNVNWSSLKVPVMKIEFSRGKNTQMSNFKKIRTVVAELFHTEGQTEGRTEDEQT
jgi:hypothetical protein